MQYRPAPGSLALYKIRPALVTEIGEKIEIQLEGGKSKRVRPKDIEILHPGPVGSLSELEAGEGNLQEAWELLAGEETQLQELTELIYGEFSPAAAWATWQRVAEGLYFEGQPERILAREATQVAADIEQQQLKQARETEWSDFVERMRQGRLGEGDASRLSEVELLALEKGTRSRLLQALGHQETPVNAHRMLSRVGYWPAEYNPYPVRQALPTSNPVQSLAELDDSLPRLDLTHLPAYAIDDEGSDDPDDAISLDGDRIWVHVADVAALVAPDSELDLEARSRAANLYLPEGIVHMLPEAATQALGLGLNETSPALSIGFCLDAQSQPVDVTVAATTIRVARHSYLEIEGRMAEPPFIQLNNHCQEFRQRRQEAGASQLNLPEVSVRVQQGEVVIKPLEKLASREMVTDLMLMAGVAVAHFAQQHDLPIAYATQPAPESGEVPQGLAAMYAFRRQLRPSVASVEPDLHSGLGLPSYCRTTSPLRRYLDLVNHQQLRRHLVGEAPLSSEEVAARIAATEPTSRTVRRVERNSNLHWKLIYLQRNPGWRGQGTVVAMEGQRATLMIPELAMETRIRLRQPAPLDSSLPLAVREIDLEDQAAWFRVVD